MAHDFKLFPELTNSQLVFYYWDSPHRQITEDFRCKVVRVIDGDTIEVRWDERDFDFPVRFLNTDSLELEEGGEASKSWLEKRILDEEVEILIDPFNRVGRWGRILGEVMHNGMSVNEESVLLGYAIPFEVERGNF
jgi:endonuclease YncB( thermonuclease family)